MSTTYRPRANVGPVSRRVVPLKSGVNGELGKMISTVSGYGKVPAAADAATGKMAGVITEAADNSGGGDGALSVIADGGEYDFKNSTTHACTAAHVGLTVYAEDGDTISSDSGDGPVAGTLVAFNPSDITVAGRPCRVRLKCEQ